MLYIHNATILTPSERIAPGAVMIEGARIAAVGPQMEVSAPPEAQRINAEGRYLVPGFIDLQINGGFGEDFTQTPESIWRVGTHLGQFGVTAFIPTIITSPLERIQRAQEVILNEKPAGYQGALPLGLHLEGPFLNPKKRGAHEPGLMRAPDTTLVEGWTPQNGIRMVTLAPELDGALELISKLNAQGVLVSAGHSNANYSEAMAGYRAGIRLGTHLFNAMSGLHHRRPGLAGALLSQPDWNCSVIVDGIHLHSAIVNLAWRLKGNQGLILVSDAMAALGMPPGEYNLGGYQVTVTEGEARLADGTLAGSLLAMDQALRNLVAMTGSAWEDVLPTLTSTPARILGLPNRRGRVEPGEFADLTLLDSGLNVSLTIAAGEIIYQKEIQ